MNVKVFFLIVAVSFQIVSCKQENLKYHKPYFDMDSLVRAQICGLVINKVSVLKKTTIGSAEDSVTITPDTVQWKHELDAFQQLDLINKPAFKTEYLANKSRDLHSNLIVLSYTKVPSEVKSAVPFLKIYYQDNLQKIRKIESYYEEGNLMFSTTRTLLLEFEDRQTGLALFHYKVTGFQKMILSSPINYSVEGFLKFLD